MSENILVTYATRTGSTAGIAETIAEVLRDDLRTVEVRPMQEVTDLTPYSAIVVGSAIQGRKWLPEAMNFVSEHRLQLAWKPSAMFSVCLTLTMRNGESYRPALAEWTAEPRLLVQPLSEACFRGFLDISQVPRRADRVKLRLAVLLRVWSEGDHRDWEAVRTWAQELSPLLSPVAA